jgi:hypothetical protein
MAKGLSLHIGLNRVNPSHYGGWAGTLAACEYDAKDMAALARKQGFKPTTLLTPRATSKALADAIGAAASTLRSGDIFFLTYSGHGGQVPDKNQDETEDDMDETWVLYDRELVDDELYALWASFEAGVRIIVLSDSCHSGTVVRVNQYNRVLPALNETPPGFRVMPQEVAKRTYARNKKLYDDIQRANPSGERAGIGASVILISGCQDAQLSSDGSRNGLFTATLLRTWNKGKFKGGYKKFHKAILQNMPLYQQPNLFMVGVRDVGFERQKPFTLN